MFTRIKQSTVYFGTTNNCLFLIKCHENNFKRITPDEHYLFIINS